MPGKRKPFPDLKENPPPRRKPGDRRSLPRKKKPPTDHKPKKPEKPKKPGKTPITRTEGGREVGLRGIQRRREIDDIVDSAQSGKK